MKTLDEVLEMMEERIDRPRLEDYITRDWIRPSRKRDSWQFDDIDIARLRLVCHLLQDIEVNEHGMDVILSLLDQLYHLRTHVKSLNHAITKQPREIQVEIMAVMKKRTKTKEAS